MELLVLIQKKAIFCYGRWLSGTKYHAVSSSVSEVINSGQWF
jgi:hypothetical protein